MTIFYIHNRALLNWRLQKYGLRAIVEANRRKAYEKFNKIIFLPYMSLTKKWENRTKEKKRNVYRGKNGFGGQKSVVWFRYFISLAVISNFTKNCRQTAPNDRQDFKS